MFAVSVLTVTVVPSNAFSMTHLYGLFTAMLLFSLDQLPVTEYCFLETSAFLTAFDVSQTVKRYISLLKTGYATVCFVDDIGEIE